MQITNQLSALLIKPETYTVQYQDIENNGKRKTWRGKRYIYVYNKKFSK